MKYRNQISSVPKYLLVGTFYIQNDKGKCANSAKPYHEDPCKRYHVFAKTYLCEGSGCGMTIC